MKQIKDLILETRKVNWQELKDLQPNNLKKPYNVEVTKQSLIKNGFARAFYVWENEGQIYLTDGHLRTDLLRELKNEGYDVPDELSCTFLNLPNKKTAIKYLLEVFNTKTNPIDNTVMMDWIAEEEIELEELTFEMIDSDSDIEEKIEEPKTLIDDNKNKDLTIKISFKNVEDLENAKVEIEEVTAKYKNVNISVSGGEL